MRTMGGRQTAESRVPSKEPPTLSALPSQEHE